MEKDNRKTKGQGRLVLTRKKGERVLIQFADQIIWVSVRGFEQGRVRLAIDAGPLVGIFREELLQGAEQCPQI